MSTLRTVNPNEIRKSLDALWEANENTNKMQASLFNIIFFTEKSPREEYVQKIAYNLIEKFPARIFFVTVDPDSADSLQTGVSVLSTKQGDVDITCDLIEIRASGSEESKVAPLLLPHIIPDLPVFLVWAKDPTKNPNVCEELKQYATRIIFDSESAEDLTIFARSVLEAERIFSCEIADLNWARLETWRTLIASVFAKPAKLPLLENVRSLQITFNGRQTPFFCHTKIQSMYLQAWIASRLRWQPTKIHPSFLSFSYRAKETYPEVTLAEIDNPSFPAGMIVSLEIQTENGDRLYFFRDKDHPDQIGFEQSSSRECSLPTKILVGKGESGQSLIHEICHKGTSEHYLETLKMIATEGLL